MNGKAMSAALANFVLLAFCYSLQACNASPNQAATDTSEAHVERGFLTGAERTDLYLPLLHDKRVGIVANQTSLISTNDSEGVQSYVHLVDSLSTLGVHVSKVFAPEHGFRGKSDAGEKFDDGVDPRTGLPIVSLYGKTRKPTSTMMESIDIVIFDIQDVGVRFFTYIATLQYVMEACAEAGLPIVVLDRPNPNARYIDGPTLLKENASFLGLNEIPLVYGMTIGEYATMINQEGWLDEGRKAQLTVIPLDHYDHHTPYSPPVPPSPNLPNDQAINLYPSLGLFEGTNVNAGRGTAYQFQRYGASFLDESAYDFSYIPLPNDGSKHPKQEGKECYGKDLRTEKQMNQVSLQWLIDAYSNCPDKSMFFNTTSFTKHAGTSALQKQIEEGLSETQIRASWQSALDNFKAIRKKYLLYND